MRRPDKSLAQHHDTDTFEGICAVKKNSSPQQTCHFEAWGGLARELLEGEETMPSRHRPHPVPGTVHMRHWVSTEQPDHTCTVFVPTCQARKLRQRGEMICL